MEDGDVFIRVVLYPLKLRVLSPATDSLLRFTIRNHSVVISHPNCDAVFSLSAVGGSQDISLVDDGTTTLQFSGLFCKGKSDWRMFKIKMIN